VNPWALLVAGLLRLLKVIELKAAIRLEILALMLMHIYSGFLRVGMKTYALSPVQKWRKL
jgi:hypothetical protein